MDGVVTQCHARHPETRQRCVRLAGTHDEHQTDHARDVYCRVWVIEEAV